MTRLGDRLNVCFRAKCQGPLPTRLGRSGRAPSVRFRPRDQRHPRKTRERRLNPPAIIDPRPDPIRLRQDVGVRHAGGHCHGGGRRGGRRTAGMEPGRRHRPAEAGLVAPARRHGDAMVGQRGDLPIPIMPRSPGRSKVGATPPDVGPTRCRPAAYAAGDRRRARLRIRATASARQLRRRRRLTPSQRMAGTGETGSMRALSARE